MKKIKIFAFLVFCLVQSVLGQSVDIEKLPTISVTGTAEIRVVPDEVTFSLRVSKSDKSLQTAKMQNDENISKIIALAKPFNIAPADVKTDFISVREKFDRVKQKGDTEYTEIFAGYTVSKTVIVKLRACLEIKIGGV